MVIHNLNLPESLTGEPEFGVVSLIRNGNRDSGSTQFHIQSWINFDSEFGVVSLIRNRNRDSGSTQFHIQSWINFDFKLQVMLPLDLENVSSRISEVLRSEAGSATDSSESHLEGERSVVGNRSKVGNVSALYCPDPGNKKNGCSWSKPDSKALLQNSSRSAICRATTVVTPRAVQLEQQEAGQCVLPHL